MLPPLTPWWARQRMAWQPTQQVPSQASKRIVFARAPKTVAMDGVPPFGHCSGYTDQQSAPCNGYDGFAIFEVLPFAGAPDHEHNHEHRRARPQNSPLHRSESGLYGACQFVFTHSDAIAHAYTHTRIHTQRCKRQRVSEYYT